MTTEIDWWDFLMQSDYGCWLVNGKEELSKYYGEINV